MNKQQVRKIKLKKIMKRAWQIARNGQSTYGGQVMDYFSIALKMAWSEDRVIQSYFSQFQKDDRVLSSSSNSSSDKNILNSFQKRLAKVKNIVYSSIYKIKKQATTLKNKFKKL